MRPCLPCATGDHARHRDTNCPCEGGCIAGLKQDLFLLRKRVIQLLRGIK